MLDHLIDPVIYLFLGHKLFVGLKRGLFNVLVDIFGIYGALFFAWYFQEDMLHMMNSILDINDDINGIVGFLIIWVSAYLLIYVLGKFITGVFKFTGVNFLLRLSGGILNLTKGFVIVMLLLTAISRFSDSLFHQTPTTKLLIGIGSKVMSVYNNNLDEHIIQPVHNNLNIEGSLIDDDFKYNFLER